MCGYFYPSASGVVESAVVKQLYVRRMMKLKMIKNERIDRVELMRTFVRIVEAGSLSAAAKQMGTTQATVSRRLQSLETLLGVKLIMRTTHAMKLTEDGERGYQHAKKIIDAWLALERTRIVSPMTGYVSRRAVQPGAQISPTTPLMAVVPATNLWVDANFKETQLAHIRIGQPATVISDIYGDDVKYTGKVVGLDMGTGSAFSLLPAQNATGNWIKVVQRLPVRIELDAQQLAQHPLRIGLSTLVTVDTSNRDGQILASQVRTTPVSESNAREIDLAPVNKMIEEIVRANAG